MYNGLMYVRTLQHMYFALKVFYTKHRPPADWRLTAVLLWTTDYELRILELSWSRVTITTVDFG
jgi:hypothetical protein